MNTFRPPAPLSEILRTLESMVLALRESDLDGSMRLQARAVDLLGMRSLDPADRMILDKVMGRVRKVSPGSSLLLGLEECFQAA